LGPVWDNGQSYLEGLIARAPSTSLQMARHMIRAAVMRDVPGLIHLVALLPVPLLMWLPFLRLRAQAF
jgi:hypothetical protein